MVQTKKISEIKYLLQKELVKIFDKKYWIVISHATKVESYPKCKKPNYSSKLHVNVLLSVLYFGKRTNPCAIAEYDY